MRRAAKVQVVKAMGERRAGSLSSDKGSARYPTYRLPLSKRDTGDDTLSLWFSGSMGSEGLTHPARRGHSCTAITGRTWRGHAMRILTLLAILPLAAAAQTDQRTEISDAALRAEIISEIVDPCVLAHMERLRIEGMSDGAMLVILKRINGGAVVERIVAKTKRVLEENGHLMERSEIFSLLREGCMSSSTSFKLPRLRLPPEVAETDSIRIEVKKHVSDPCMLSLAQANVVEGVTDTEMVTFLMVSGEGWKSYKKLLTGVAELAEPMESKQERLDFYREVRSYCADEMRKNSGRVWKRR